MTNIPKKNIMELKDLIYTGVISVCGKIGVPVNNTNRKTKSGWEIRLETLRIKLQQQAKMQRQKSKKIYSGVAKRAQLERKILFEETNQNLLAKEARLRR